jgi:hypothetical protein
VLRPTGKDGIEVRANSDRLSFGAPASHGNDVAGLVDLDPLESERCKALGHPVRAVGFLAGGRCDLRDGHLSLDQAILMRRKRGASGVECFGHDLNIGSAG